MSQDFRTTLREKTHADHERVDAMFSRVNIAQHDGFSLFVRVHLTCFSKMQEHDSISAEAKGLLAEMVDALTLDLDLLGEAPHDIKDTKSKSADPLAVDYMIAGSRLGSKVLRKRWAASSDPIVVAAGTYFGLSSDPEFWRTTCRALSDIPNDSARADVIVEDTRALFGLFAQNYGALTAQTGVHS